MKILHFLPWYSTSYVGGTEQYLLNLAKAQVRNGNEVEILQPNNMLKDEIRYVEGVKVNLFSYPDEDRSPAFIFGVSKQQYEFDSFKELLSRINPDIIHFHGTDARFKYLHEIIDDMNVAVCFTPHFVGFSCPDGTLRQKGRTQCNGEIKMLKCSNCIITKNKKVPPYLRSVVAAGINAGYFLAPKNIKHNARLFSLPFRIDHRSKFLKYLGERPNIKFDVLNNWYETSLLKNVINDHLKLLKPGGLLTITTPNFKGFMQYIPHKFFDNANLKKHYLPSMNPNRWKNILEKKGFIIRHYGYFGGYQFWVDGEVKRNKVTKVMLRITERGISQLNKIVRFFGWESKLYSSFCGVVATKIP